MSIWSSGMRLAQTGLTLVDYRALQGGGFYPAIGLREGDFLRILLFCLTSAVQLGAHGDSVKSKETLPLLLWRFAQTTAVLRLR